MLQIAIRASNAIGVQVCEEFWSGSHMWRTIQCRWQISIPDIHAMYVLREHPSVRRSKQMLGSHRSVWETEMNCRSFVTGLALAGAWPASSFGQSAKAVKIGVLNDMSSVYADYQGIGSVIAVRMALEDDNHNVGMPVDLVSADHQNKPDIGLSIARRWFDTEGVDVIMDVPNSAVALAVAQLCRDKNKVLIGSGAGSADLTGKACTPNTVHWTYDTWQLGNSYGRALTTAHAKRWFFVTADYAFGKALEESCASAVRVAGGEVLGSARHPIAATDFSSYLVQAQSSGADVVAFCNAGDDLNNSLKQVAEFHLAPKQKLVGLIFNITNVPGLGLKACAGLEAISSFYWDLDDSTRAFSIRFQALHPRRNMPNDMQAGCYAASWRLGRRWQGGCRRDESDPDR